MAWGSWAGPSLDSSLGSGSGTWGSWAAPAVGGAGGGGGGGNGWLGSLTDPLGIVSGVKAMGTGITKAFGTPVYRLGHAIGEGLQGDFGDAGRDLGGVVQGVGDIAAGTTLLAENLVTTAALPFGGTGGLTKVLKEDVFQPFNRWMSGYDENGPMHTTTPWSKEMGEQLYNEGTGLEPVDFWTEGSQQGLGFAALNTAGQLALIAAPVVGVTRALAGDAVGAAAAAEAAGATASAAAWSAKAARMERMTTVLGNVAHPLKSAGFHTADVLGAMRESAFPAKFDAPIEEATPISTLPKDPYFVPQEVMVAARDAMHPEAAAAEAMAQSADTVASTFADLGRPPETVRFSRVGAPGAEYVEGAPNPSRASGTAAEDMGRVHVVDVPKDIADTLPRGPNGEVEVPAEFIPQEVTPVKVGAPKVEPRVEPRSYNVKKGRVVTPEEAKVLDEQLRSETAQARAHVDPPLYVLDELGQRINTPTPEWANQLAERMPDSVNRLLGRVGANFVDQVRYRNVYRNLMQAMETTQNVARSSTGMRAGETAARLILDRYTDRPTASARVGEEIHARLNGEALLAEWTKSHNGFTPSKVQEAKLREAARAGYKGVTDELLAKLTPEDAAAFQEAINQAVIGFREASAKTMETLLATRYGAKGLEAALLSPDEVMMTPEQVRMYKRIERDERAAAKARERVPGEIEKALANEAKAEAVGARAHGFVDQLRAKLGLTLSTADDLYRGIPKGLERDGAATIGLAMHTLATEGGALIDVGLGKVERPSEGIHIQVRQQFDIPLADWATEGQRVLHDALFEPKAHADNVYDPQRLWGGADAKLSINLVDGVDGAKRVVGSIAMHTVNGDAMQPWQAHILGAAHEAVEGFDFRTGKRVALPLDPNEQALAMHYIGDVLDSKSGMSRWASERAKLADDADLSITHAQVNAEMMANLWLDHIIGGRNPRWEHGDVFKTEISKGTNEPTLDYLAQTIMEDITLPAHVDKAMVMADVQNVNRILSWYYTSHEFVEGLYRGKTTPFGRDAADSFYDVLAISSIMASPTQNLGRALAGFANLDDFLKIRKDALADATKVMDEVMGNKPAKAVYVKNLGVRPEDIVRLPGEKDVAYKRRQVKESERLVAQGEGGTAISQRWFDSPLAKDLSHQTSMTTQPKYRIIDALLGKFDLEHATAETIGAQPEWWVEGTGGKFSDKNLPPADVMQHAELLGITAPELAAYKLWSSDHAELVAAREVRELPNYVEPITDAVDVQRKRAEAEALAKGETLLGGREVSPAEYQALAAEGRIYVERALANSTPHGLDTPEVRSAAWEALHPAEGSDIWPGGTFDSHTGVPIPGSYRGDTYAVTARLKGMKEVTVPIKASPKQFDAAYTKALKMYKDVLDSEGGHLGIFENQDTQRIEFDPVYHTRNVAETEAVGTYTHANGGAYNFQTEYGFWLPHVKDTLHWSNKGSGAGLVARSATEGQRIAKSEALRPAYENALMEYHGSGLLAKLRSFRDNLAHPESSLAVTLDSIMAQLFGIDGTPWQTKGEYSMYAAQIRESAKEWSTFAGREVKPHEVQALLWVYAKRYIGEQDWGRLQAHVKNAHEAINFMEDAVVNGKKLNVKNFDALTHWWKEERGFSQDQLDIRTERTPLREKRTAGTLTETEAARLDYLENVATRQASKVQILGDDGKLQDAVRHETGFDAKTLDGKNAQYVAYLQEVAAPMRKAIEAGDFNTARSLLDEYVTKRKKAIMGSVEGDAFGPEMLRDPKGVSHQSMLRLKNAEHVPSPNVAGLNIPELLSKFGNRVRGATLETPNKMGRIMMRLYSTADVSTLLHEDLHAFRLHAPGDEVAILSRTYEHIQDATLTPARIAAEERFVTDFMGYLRSRASVADTRLSPAMRAQQAKRYAGPLGTLFGHVADTMEQHYGPALNTESGRAVPNEIVNYWDSIFNQDIQRPVNVNDPLSAQYAPTPRGVNPTQNRGEPPAAFAQRSRQYGEARGKATVLQQRIADAERLARKADKFHNEMSALIMEPTESLIEAKRHEARSQDTAAKLAEQLADPQGRQVPRGWKGFMGALDNIRDEAAKDPSLAPLLEEIPANFAEALRFAAQRGFEPTYMPELTWDMAQKYMYGHLQLGGKLDEAGLRKENRGVISKAEVTDRTLESLGAGTVIAMKELLQSRLMSFTEESYARFLPPGTEIPDGWHAWEPTRDAIITGRKLGEGRPISVNTTKIIPNAVYEALRTFQRQQVDLPFRFVWKGAPVTVWKHLVLTFSPTWYIKNFIGTVSMATAEGVTLRDWATAIKQYRSDTLPSIVRGRSIHRALESEMGDVGTLISRHGIKDVPDLVRSEGFKMAAHEMTARLRNVDMVMDSIGRAAVYAKTLRTGGSVAKAASRAAEALADFGRLSPIERSLVVQIIPFYAFQKAMFRMLAKMPVDHPAASAILMQLGTMHQQYLAEQLGGSLPEAFANSDFIGGSLVNLDFIVPQSQGWQLARPEGIANSMNPFLKLLARDALNAPGYGSKAGMDARGNLVQKPNLGESLLGTFTGAIPGLGKPTDRLYKVGNPLSDEAYERLVKRIKKAQDAGETVDAGGYLQTVAYAKAQGKKAKGWGSWSG